MTYIIQVENTYLTPIALPALTRLSPLSFREITAK
jgi:hypothetical protein